MMVIWVCVVVLQFVIPGLTRDPEQKGMACFVSLDPGSQAGVTSSDVECT